MHFNLEVIRRYTHAIEFVEQSYTIENTFKEMIPVWEKLLSEDGSSIIVRETLTRSKAQLVQLYARDLMKYVNSIIGLTLFPITQEDIKVGNWRVDSIILQIASNDIKDHRHLFELMMTNLYGVPTVMFEFSKEKSSTILAKYLENTFQGIKLQYDETREVSLVGLEEKLVSYLNSEEVETVITLN